MTYIADITLDNGDACITLERKDKESLINSLSEYMTDSYDEIENITLSTKKD